MATLKIRKSENEILELPLTTEKPIARSLAIFQDGKVYYCPLVHSGEYLDSGVKVRIDGNTYALANEIYDPVTYNSSGIQWENYRSVGGGRALLSSRNRLALNAGNYWSTVKTVTLSSSSSFSFSCQFFVNDFSVSRHLFDAYITSTKRFFLYINTSQKLLLGSQTTSSNSATIKTLSGTLDSDAFYIVTVSYNNGVWTTIFNGTASTVSKSIPSGDYTINIGANYNKNALFVGVLWDLSFSFNGVNGRFRFGD